MAMENEIWKKIEGVDYSVSNYGRIKTHAKILVRKNGFIAPVKEIIRKPVKHNRGYLCIVLYNNGEKTRAYIHRLAATAFIPNNENKKEVNHINGVKDDNRAENLEWASPKENMIHAVINGLHKMPPKFGTSNSNFKNGKFIIANIEKECEQCHQKFIAKYNHIRFCSKVCTGRNAVAVMAISKQQKQIA